MACLATNLSLSYHFNFKKYNYKIIVAFINSSKDIGILLLLIMITRITQIQLENYAGYRVNFEIPFIVSSKHQTIHCIKFWKANGKQLPREHPIKIQNNLISKNVS